MKEKQDVQSPGKHVFHATQFSLCILMAVVEVPTRTYDCWCSLLSLSCSPILDKAVH